jgi:hypothetical protein
LKRHHCLEYLMTRKDLTEAAFIQFKQPPIKFIDDTCKFGAKNVARPTTLVQTFLRAGTPLLARSIEYRCRPHAIVVLAGSDRAQRLVTHYCETMTGGPALADAIVTEAGTYCFGMNGTGYTLLSQPHDRRMTSIASALFQSGKV